MKVSPKPRPWLGDCPHTLPCRMPRSSILSLVVLPIILATAVFVWTPNIAVETRAAGLQPERFTAEPPDFQAQGAIDALIDTYYLDTTGAGRETQRELQVRGRLAHVWSIYGGPGSGEATELNSGSTRSFQLRDSGRGWEIVSVATPVPWGSVRR